MKKTILCLLAVIIPLAAATGLALSLLTAKVPADDGQADRLLYIDSDDTPDSVRTKSRLGWRWDIYTRAMTYRLHTGRYRVAEGMTCLELFRNLRAGAQEPMRLVVPSVRTMDRLASVLGESLMADSSEIAGVLTDSVRLDALGYTTATVPALFIPNTYEVYWDISVDQLLERMQTEHSKFWNEARRAKAEALGLTPTEVATLASIVDEETANNAEKPMIAGLYLNRLRRGMLLQADPTVKFAVGDFTLRRILANHLKVESPYNTYRHPGLPPGPIRIPSIAGLEAVLGATDHPYLYMCAKADFSGTHNFATTLQEHYRNARLYIRALNERGIR